MSKILIVLSAADTWTRTDGTEYPTGFWAEEVVVIHETFVAAGAELTIATPGGRAPTADPHSLDPEVAGPEAPRYGAYLRSIAAALDAPLDLAAVDAGDYDAIVVPGGHGPVVDLYQDPSIGRLLTDADEDEEKVIGVVCHGQAALLSANRPNGDWQFAGRRLTAFSDEEEVEFGTADNAPWLLAQTLRERGARYEQGPNWDPHVVRDGRLISGQNPASSGAMARAVLEALTRAHAA